MNSFFNSDFFAGNRQRLRALYAAEAPIVITANGLMQRSSDTAFAFRQDSNFWYLTGINDPDVVLVIDKESEYLISPSRGDTRTVFDGSLDIDAMRLRSGVSEIVDDELGWKRLSTRLKKSLTAATLAASPAYITHHGIFSNPARATLVRKLKDVAPSIELVDVREHLMQMRIVKQPAELSVIQAAVDLTVKSFKRVPKMLEKTSSEYSIDAELTRLFRKERAGHAYAPIVATGKNACTLHYIANNAEIETGELLLIDAGAEVENYAADITRTFTTGKSTKRQLQVLNAVKEVQDLAYSVLKPGVTLQVYESKIEQFMGEKLRSLGLIKTISHEEVRRFYPHSSSHFLGLDVHDVGDYHRPLEAGMVLTVEPGIYIPDEKIGVRIEDNIVITDKGNRILSKNLPSIF